MARLPIESLTLVTAMIDTLAASTPLERGVREVGPAFARVLHPLPAVECATLGRTAALRVC